MRLSIISKRNGLEISAPLTPFHSAMDVAKSVGEQWIMLMRVYFDDEQIFNSWDGPNDTPTTSTIGPFGGKAVTSNDHLIVIFPTWMIFFVSGDQHHCICMATAADDVEMTENYNNDRSRYIKSLLPFQLQELMKQAWELMEQQKEKEHPEWEKFKASQL